MQGAHHGSTCNDAGTTTTETAPITVDNIHVAPSKFTYLQTARVRVVGPTGLNKLTRCFGQRESDQLRQQVHYRRLEIRRY